MASAKVEMMLSIYFALVTVLHCAPGYPLFCYPGQEKISFTNGTTYCQDCQDGFYSSDGERCLPCAVCDRGQAETTPCLKTHDRGCVCAAGSFFNYQTHTCSQCTSCPVGSYQSLPCEFNLDRKCEPCPPNFTSLEVNSKHCVPDRPSPKTDDDDDNDDDDDRLDDGSRTNIMVAVVVPLAIIITVVCAVAIACFFRRRKKGDRINNNENTVEMAAIPLTAAVEVESSCPPVCKKVDASKGTLFRKLSASISQELGDMLNPQRSKNWKSVAAALGFSLYEIGHFELQPKNATQEMLNDWTTQAGATVNKLFNILVDIRPDAAELLEPFITR